MGQSMNEAVCASCGQVLGVRANWRLINGRAYHNDCEPAPVVERPEPPKETLTEHAERAARNVMAPGQPTLEEGADE